MTSKIVKTALERFQLAEEAEALFRNKAAEDLNFVAGDQWNSQAKNNREQAGLPCYTVNKVQEYLRHITNEIRQNKPSIQVDPTSEGAAQTTADIVAGLIRHIEYDSSADTAYDTASWYAAACGLGYIRVVSEYEDFTTDNQKLMIKTIENPLNVFYDPNSKMPDGSDAEWCFIVSDIPMEEFKRKYGSSALATSISAGDWTEMKNTPTWLSENTVRVAEYYYKEYHTKTLYTVQREPNFDHPTGMTYTTYDRPSDEELESGKAIITKKRSVDIPEIKWCTLNCKEILEETVWPGEWIPVIPVKGNEIWINGKHELFGSVRFAKDAQRSYNWLVSIQTQMIAAAPLAPFVGFKGQFKDVEQQWRDVNVKPIAYLEIDSEDINGHQQQVPQRINNEANIQSVSSSRAMASDDIKSIFGTFDAAMGAQGNEVSGKAILARTNQANLSNYHYYDNLTRSITHLGRIFVQVIPKFYDTERVIRIVNQDGTRTMKTINTVDPKTGQPKNDLSIGKYDVVIQTGPSYATRRQEAAIEMQTLMQTNPNISPLIADLAAQAMDWPGAALVAKRLKAAVPPQILQATGEDQGDEMEPAAKSQMLQQKLVQATQQIQQLSEQIHLMDLTIKEKDEENKIMKMHSMFDIAKAENDKNIKLKQLQQDEETTVLEFRIKNKEIELQREQMIIEREKLELEKAKLSVAALKAASDVSHGTMDRVHDSIKIVGSTGSTDEIPDSQTGMQGDLNEDLGGKFNA